MDPNPEQPHTTLAWVVDPSPGQPHTGKAWVVDPSPGQPNTAKAWVVDRNPETAPHYTGLGLALDRFLALDSPTPERLGS